MALLALAVLSVFAYTQMRTTGAAALPRGATRYGMSSHARPTISTRKPAASYEPEVPDSPRVATRRAAGLRAADGREYAIGAEAAIIGSSPDACQVVLEGAGVAPEHARIWIRDGRCLLHHVGGMSRKTYVGSDEVEWVVLEPGDEVRIGSPPPRLPLRRRARIGGGRGEARAGHR